MENYEEKYKDALDNFKKIKAANKDNKELVDFIEYEYPELKESEDESVRKHLLKHFMAKTKEEWNGMPIKNIIAWLEKQGKQKPVLNNALKEAFDKSRKDYYLKEKKEASDYSESIIPTSIAYGESEEEYMLHKIIEAAFIAGQNTKQKSAWSEEDEIGLGNAMWAIEQARSIAKDKNDMGNLWHAGWWLKSIKERLKGK